MLKYELYHGNCLEIMDRLIVNNVKVNAIITDPPFGSTKCKWDIIIPFDDMWNCIKKIRYDNTPIVLFGSEPFSSLLRYSNLKEYKYDWIYQKTTSTGHLNSKKMPMKSHENISIFYKKQCFYNPQKTKNHERKISSAKHKRNCIQTEIYNNHGFTSYNSTERYPLSVQKFKTDKQKYNYHPTQKPVSLMEYLIRTYTNENDIVLDFTCGSGSTGVACKALNRRFIGIDNGLCKNKKSKYVNWRWIDIAKYRISSTIPYLIK